MAKLYLMIAFTSLKMFRYELKVLFNLVFRHLFTLLVVMYIKLQLHSQSLNEVCLQWSQQSNEQTLAKFPTRNFDFRIR